MAARFHELKVASIERQTPEAVAVAFEIPDGLKDAFAFRPGQYLTLAADIDGQEARRSYSICSAPGDETLRVGVKRVADGRFSSFVNETLSVGDTIRVMPPEGRFTSLTGERHDYVLVAAGSGITPMLSIAKTVLGHEADSTITLVYGNRSTDTIMFREELEDLKDRYMRRFSLIHMLSREAQDVELLNGRIDGPRIGELSRRGLIDLAGADGVFLCGPGEMIDDVSASLRTLGVEEDRIRFERFTPSGDAPKPRPRSAEAQQAAEAGVQIEVVLDGVRRAFPMGEADATVLDAAHRAGLEIPYSCAGGMCCTCRCRVAEGEAEMAVNYSLQPWEIEAGFTLACQTRPTSKKLVLDFDAA
ncbi:phenylacetate-CoA oxygenase/reductase subunit PaaK [Mesorhizobium microcysteis]|uniref:Phenylacetate-CoA oxygenase/reductase subunit PaaK n=1 Tax=Neoaquamicrobium microcysteis TaxID=2682781 RepID=A0A5D4GWE2_9HYPH|nr:1,2-phenylacetyl-CoA epoxidase subunit PaaE [Mesorhizobium microcysteis]TYR32332.1 phenylacetate-CoA oxygenase/reductase subunit PaaK [Mesorhizobium microcysteis]